ncbi:AHH domain-containing protein [Parendozoicomonas sp. Alg238-R29]|uniref:AHH domain-containing protein n=1 Tax=Parendozoicomonas sp. Alg238-R29 TaxID=2993446 RepID=UPI00248E867C|nr:AHH domain-containing protein [Parendozoicomonas sp. Alg238-R29]
MALPEYVKPRHECDLQDMAELRFVAKDKPTTLDLMAVHVASQVEAGLDTYRAEAGNMRRRELRAEKHQSSRLAIHLAECGDEKPHPKCHAHAIVSGAHREAATMRAILAREKVRIDDAHNGCWLPENTAAIVEMPRRLRTAVPHSRIHRYNYYFWLGRLINLEKTQDSDDLRYTLKTVGLQLQAGAQPSYVMMKKGEGLPV